MYNNGCTIWMYMDPYGQNGCTIGNVLLFRLKIGEPVEEDNNVRND